MRKCFLFALAVFALAACSHKEMTEPVPEAGQTVTLTFDVSHPSPDSKVAFGGGDNPQLAWTGDETMTLIFGKYTADGADNATAPVLRSTAPGIFSGTVTIPSGFTIDDLQGIVVPSEVGATYDWNKVDAETGAVTAYISMPVAAEQVQAQNGVPNFSYAPFFYDLSAETKTASADGSYTFANRTLSSASEMLRFRVFGALEDGETLKSVTLNTLADCHVGLAKWQLGRESTKQIENSGSRSSTVSLTEEVVIPKTVADTTEGVDVYMSYMCKNNRVITEVIVVTDKNTYKKSFPTSGDDRVLLSRTYVNSFNITKVGLDLSNGFLKTGGVTYSADGDQWSETIPATFSTLYVKTPEGGFFTEAELTAIAEAVKAQTSVELLDMSGAVYESNVLPAIFKATAAAPDTKLKSVKFPSNVDELAEGLFGYYKAMESIDFSGIRTIGAYVCQYAGLKTLTIPSNVTKIGSLAFRYLESLETLYFNPTIDYSKYTDQDLTNGLRYLSNRDTEWNNKDWNNRNNPTSVTFGPNATLVTGYFFDSNAKVTEIIVEGDNLQFVYQWGLRARNIERFEFKGALPTWHPVHSPGNGDKFADELGDKEGVVVVPVGQYEVALGNDFIKRLLDTGKYRLREKGDEDSMEEPSPVIEYSTDAQIWASELPETFTKLYVRTKYYAFTKAELDAIKASMDSQAAAVELDLSGAVYESETFPKIFAGTSGTKLYTKLKSIKFPRNVTTIAESAFQWCDLESVDLTGITTIQRLAFKYAGLKTLNVPSSVNNMALEVFSYLKNATDIYYNATMTGYVKANSGYKFLCNRDKDNYGTGNSNDTSSWNNKDNPLTVTIGPDVIALPPYFFDTNAKLTNLIIEANGLTFFDQWAIRAHYLSRIEFKGTPPADAYKNLGGDALSKIGAGEALIVCPDGTKAEFEANGYIHFLLGTGKFVLVEKSQENTTVK